MSDSAEWARILQSRRRDPPWGKGRLVVVIEPEVEVSDFICRGLIYKGFEPVTISDLTAGIAAATSSKPALVLFDLDRQGADAAHVVTQLKATGSAVILLTTPDARTEDVAGLHTDADAVVVKPFGFDELLGQMRRVLGP